MTYQRYAHLRQLVAEGYIDGDLGTELLDEIARLRRVINRYKREEKLNVDE